MAHFDVGQGAQGMQKYLMRQEQAKEMRADKERREQKVFKTGQNWKPAPTVPKTPKISAPAIKGERNYESNVKALSKPVNSIRKQLNPDAQTQNQMLDEIGGYESLGMPPGSTMVQNRGHRANQKSAAQHQFYATLQKQQSASAEGVEGLVKLDSEMSFDQARGLIHSHILDLDI